MSETDETSKLKYEGSRLPWLVLLPWGILLIFCGVYLFRYSWPDLQHWIR